MAETRQIETAMNYCTVDTVKQCCVHTLAETQINILLAIRSGAPITITLRLHVMFADNEETKNVRLLNSYSHF